MKKLSKNQKNALLIGGGVLAVLAATQLNGGSPSQPKVKLISTDNNRQIATLSINGKQFNFPYGLMTTHQIGGGYAVQGLPFAGGVKRFVLLQNGTPIKEVFTITA